MRSEQRPRTRGEHRFDEKSTAKICRKSSAIRARLEKHFGGELI